MRSFSALVLFIGVVIALGGCRREEAPEEVPEERTGLVVADTTIMREITTRMDADPRLDDPEIQLEARSKDGQVTLVGVVPTRRELSIAHEVAMSTPGVNRVWLDSVRVVSEGQAGP